MKNACGTVNPKYPTRSDILQFTADEIGDLGFDTIKIYMTPNYSGTLDPSSPDYPNQAWDSTYSNLTELAQDTAFEAVLGDARFSTIIITAYTFANGIGNNWIVNLTPEQIANEESELYTFCKHLLDTYSNKTFIIQLWENDWILIGSYNPDATVVSYRDQRMVGFLAARQRAVTRAALDSDSSSRIFNVVECNRVLDGQVRVHRDVLTKIMPDIISLSMYEAINTWTTNQAETEDIIEHKMRQIIARLDFATRKFARGKPIIMIGEFGWPLAEPGWISTGLDVGGLIQRVIDVATEFGFEAAVYWQNRDNTEISPGNPRGYYLIMPDNSLSAAGIKYQSIL